MHESRLHLQRLPSLDILKKINPKVSFACIPVVGIQDVRCMHPFHSRRQQQAVVRRAKEYGSVAVATAAMRAAAGGTP